MRIVIIAVVICVLSCTVNAEDEQADSTPASEVVESATPLDEKELAGPLTDELMKKLNSPQHVPEDLVEVEPDDELQKNKDKGSKEDDKQKTKHKEDSEDEPDIENARGGHLYKLDMEAGDMGDLAGANIHFHVPREYKDFARRYNDDRDDDLDRAAEEKLHQAVEDAQLEEDAKHDEDENLRPVKADPKLVIAVARQSAQLEDSRPPNPSDSVVQSNIIRSGDYWNTVWKEDVPDPTQSLRSPKQWHRNRKPSHKLEAVRVKVMPGSKLYKLVALAKRISPKLLYIINNRDY